MNTTTTTTVDTEETTRRHTSDDQIKAVSTRKLAAAQKALANALKSIATLERVLSASVLDPDEVKTVNLTVFGPLRRSVAKHEQNIKFWSDFNMVKLWMNGNLE